MKILPDRQQPQIQPASDRVLLSQQHIQARDATQHIREERGNRVETDWRTIAIAHILEFADIEDKHPRVKRKGA